MTHKGGTRPSTPRLAPGTTALLAGCALLLAVPADAVAAESTAYACRVEISGGLKWERGRWRVRRLFEDKFVLTMTGDSFTPESVAEVLNSGSASCTVGVFGRISCLGDRGGHLVYDPATSRGGISRINSATSIDPERRETISVEVFACKRLQ